MKNITIIIILISHFCFSQERSKLKTYLHFDSSSKKTYSVELNGKTTTEQFYSKGIMKNGDITFYIGKEMFYFNNKEVDTCKIEHLKNIKISDLNILKKEINKTNPLYPYKVFPKLYLVEKINDSLIVKYKVKWEYYIE